MSDKYFTLMLVPERSDRVRKITLPTLYLRIASVIGTLLLFGGIYIFFDYLHVLSQVADNKRLRSENHILRMDVQAAKNRLDSLDQSVTRLKSFAQKLRILGNLDSVQGSKLLSEPEPGSQMNSNPQESEDSGTIEDPDRSGALPQPKDEELSKSFEKASEKSSEKTSKNSEGNAHVEWERSRRLSLLGGELAANFEAQSLLDQINQISQASFKLQEITEVEEQSYAFLSELLQEKVERLLATPSIIPTRGFISSNFGFRYNPFSGSRTFHAGIDIANRVGTKIFAPADGLVTYTGSLGGFGNVVRIEHGFGIVTKYGHNSKITVKKGDRVKRGDLIAEMGSSGRSTGPHLHYQVEMKGRSVNPKHFILEDTF